MSTTQLIIVTVLSLAVVALLMVRQRRRTRRTTPHSEHRPPPSGAAVFVWRSSARAGLPPLLSGRLRLGPLLRLGARLVAPGSCAAVARPRPAPRWPPGRPVPRSFAALPRRADRAAHVAHDEEPDHGEDRSRRAHDQPERRASEGIVVSLEVGRLRLGLLGRRGRRLRKRTERVAAARVLGDRRRGRAERDHEEQHEAAARHSREASSPTLAPARPRRPVVRTPGFQPGNAGSIPAGAIASCAVRASS